MMFTGADIAAATRGTLVRDGPAGEVATDSRRIPPGSWFVALRGDRFDGHDFLPHAAAAGCAGAVATIPPDGWKGGLVLVPDTLLALQDLGRAARLAFEGPVIGLTGSAGKTTTRAMVVEVLRERGRVHHTEGNLNNHIGVPLTLCACPIEAELLVVEMGMNHPGEIAVLQDIAGPDVRLITNVGAAHVEGCGSVEGVAEAKRELFAGARPGDTVLVNDDDPFIRAMLVPAHARVVRYGRGEHCTVRLTDVALDTERLQTRVRVETPDGTVLATLGVPGAHMADNALAAVAVGYVNRVPVERMGPALGRFQPVGMRNRVERLGTVLLLDDAYNANPVSMGAALRTLASLPGRRIAVLGDMLELGAEEDALHAEVLALTTSLGVDRVLVTGARMLGAAHAEVERHPDAVSLAAALVPTLLPGDVVLVKGSRGARMERVSEAIRGHLLPRGA